MVYCSQSAEDNRLPISQKLTSSWYHRGKSYNIYVVSVTNKSPYQTLTALKLSILLLQLRNSLNVKA